MKPAAAYPKIVLMVTLLSNQWTWLTGGQQIFVRGDQGREQNGAGFTSLGTPYQDMTTMTASFQVNDSNKNDAVTTATPSIQRPVLGVGQFSHDDQVFLWTSHQQLYTSLDKGLLGHVFLTIQGKRTTFQCALECLKHARCSSFNFRRISDLCELSDSSHVQSPGSVVDAIGCEYHTKSTFSVDERALGPCAGEPCSGHGRCLETRSVSGDPAHLCLCDLGWAGSDCSLTDTGPQWGDWAPWSACSVSCHRGWRMRTRNCEDLTNGNTLSSGQCYGASQEYGICELQQCPRWENWGAWGECSTTQTCGSGVKVRQRACSNGGTVGVDRYCLGLANESSPCTSVTCNGPVRLMGGSAPSEGRVEIYDDVHHQWSLLCADQMTTAMATMVCRQLGWPGGHQAVTDGRFGLGSGQFGLTSMTCQGSELTIAACEHNKWTAAGICRGGATVAAGVQCDVNGVWSLWSAWSECSVTCENGTRTRTRQCDHPPRLHGGRDCVGDSTQTKNCSLHMCPVDGVWEAWGPWHACSVTCSNGTQIRTRDCHGPFYQGDQCQGPANDTRDCMDRYCPVDGVWDMWSGWSECSLSCANGTRTRDRNCTGPFYEGRPCQGQAQDEERCNTHDCPVDGEWLQWQAWGQCSVSCGGGSRTRVRECKQPLHGGAVCDGNGTQTDDCNQHNCPIDGVWSPWTEWSECSVTCSNGTQDRNRTCVGPFHLGAPCSGEDYQIQVCIPRKCPVDGQWMDWAPWSACDVSCGGGTRDRSRDCYLGQYGGANCTGSDKDTSTCNEHSCPVDGVWLSWSVWSACSQSCGNGSQERQRLCDGPFHGGLNCSGPGQEDRECNTQPCPIDGIFEPWSEWEACSLTCGGGTRLRSRNCTGPFHGGADCEGAWGEEEDCNVEPCPVDGSWKPWSSWGECSVTCGGGYKSRIRECDFALHGGENCTGASEQETTCNMHHCPVDGVWQTWTQWSSCTVTCGGGNQSRTRDCFGPFYGGQPCDGPADDMQNCSTHNCPEDGYFSAWSPWEACDVTCGGGIQRRNRTCVGPFHGGQDCEGPPMDNRTCNTHPCPIEGVFTHWSAWSDCTVTCGGGVANRSRNCTGPFHGGEDCDGPLEDGKACNVHPCPEDGLWEPWSVWSACSESCGGGEQSRERLCLGTLHGGTYCQGEHNQTRDCNTHHCPVDGVWLQWSAWEMCTVTCGGGQQSRNRSCDGPYHKGLDCQGPAEENQTCNTHPCPIDGFYGEWSAWSQCSLSCGNGTQSRDRPCTPPQHQGQDCQGPSNQSQDCNTHPCPVDGYYYNWSAWSQCPVSCGGGVQWRNRTCEEPKHGGQDCQGPENVTQDCNTQPCPIDGVWLAWGQWSVCTTTCGGGQQERTRLCQQPQHGGQPCLGPEKENMTCSENPCPIPGDWYPWSNWTSCTVTCGGGTKFRERVCNIESYGNLTAPCEGPANETVACHTFDCFPLARTCTELGLRGLRESTIADIDLDGPGITSLEPVQVYCDMEVGDGIGVTVIGHDQEDRQRVQGWEGAREYEVVLHYNISFDHVEELVDQSGECEQYISWECFAALIHNPNDNFKVSTGWLNRTGQIADYFGGASPGSRSCACGMNATCVEEDLKCNCDANDEVWRQDDGFLTFKDDLPVYAFVAGDTGGKQEDGYQHIGPLSCHGKETRILKKNWFK